MKQTLYRSLAVYPELFTSVRYVQKHTTSNRPSKYYAHGVLAYDNVRVCDSVTLLLYYLHFFPLVVRSYNIIILPILLYCALCDPHHCYGVYATRTTFQRAKNYSTVYYCTDLMTKKMNSTQTLLERTDIPNEADWALQGDIPDSINATGLLAEDLEEYGGLTEIQTLILACVATVIPLFLGLLLVLGVRMVWKKYKNHNTNSGYDNDGLRREDSCDAVKSSSFMQSAEELKTSESQYSVLMPDDAASAAVCCYAAANGASAPLPPLLYNSPPNNRFGDTNKTNLNGSIITLTMKNNHLIVETEERVPGVCMASASEVAAAAAATAAAEAAAKSMDYEYDDDEFDMEAEMLRREFREASLLANGDGGSVCGPAAVNPAVLELSSQTQVDLTVDRRPTASAAVQPPPHQLQPAAADHSSGGSSSVDSRVAEMAYAYGNQLEYTAEDVPSKHCGKAFAVVKPAAVVSSATAITVNNSNNNNDDEYLVEQRLLGNGADGDGGGGCTGNGNSPELPPPNADNCSPEDCGLAPAAATATVSQ